MEWRQTAKLFTNAHLLIGQKRYLPGKKHVVQNFGKILENLNSPKN